MATAREHLERAKKNEEFLSRLRNSKRFRDFPEWGVTAAFYVAVHYGRALLAGRGTQITSHRHFQTVFHREIRDRLAYGYFRKLQTASEKSRYDAVAFRWDEVDSLVTEQLGPFKSALQAHGLNLAP